MNHEILSVLQEKEIDIYAFFDTLSVRLKEHSHAVAKVTVRLAEWITQAGWDGELPPLSPRELYQAVLFHDIGLTLIPAELLEKCEDITGPERRVIERHAMYGGQLLDKYRRSPRCPEREQLFWRIAAETAASHHERWDGKGYPHGLKASATPFLSRVVAIADSYDSIVRGASYRMPLPPEYAALEIVSNAGRQFDPQLTEIFRVRCLTLTEDNISQKQREEKSK